MCQCDVDEWCALVYLYDGRFGNYFEWVEKNECVVVHMDSCVMDVVFEDWRCVVGEHGIVQVVFIVRDNDTRVMFNIVACEHLRGEG